MELEKNPKTRPIYKKLLKLVDKAVGIAFPEMRRVSQITSYHCGPAVLEDLFSFVGVRVSQRGIVKSLRAQKKIKRVGLSVRDLAKAAGFLSGGKFNFWRKANARVADINAAVNKFHFPVGVEWQGVFYEFEDEDSGHYGVITGIDTKAGTVRMADPYPEFSGVDRRFDVGFFVKRWWDKNVIKGRTLTDRRMMFVITPKVETWPKKLGMKRV